MTIALTATMEAVSLAILVGVVITGTYTTQNISPSSSTMNSSFNTLD